VADGITMKACFVSLLCAQSRCWPAFGTDYLGGCRYLDSLEDEQVRGITMKASSISLLYVPGSASNLQVRKWRAFVCVCVCDVRI
jgi:hypothetical protein